jgi:hypothetical protein
LKWFLTIEKQPSMGLYFGMYDTFRMGVIFKFAIASFTDLHKCTYSLSINKANGLPFIPRDSYGKNSAKIT